MEAIWYILFFGAMGIGPLVLFSFGLATIAYVIWAQIRIIRRLGWKKGRFVVTVPLMLVSWGYWVMPPRVIHHVYKYEVAREWLDAASLHLRGEGPKPENPGIDFAATYGDPFGNPPVLAWVAVFLSALGLAFLLRKLRRSGEVSSSNLKI